MAFKSAVTPDYLRGQIPYVKFKYLNAGGVRGYLSKQVDIEGRLYVELDHDTGRIRLKQAPPDDLAHSFAMGKARARGFAIGKPAMKEIGTEERIYLELAADGWYYGSYKDLKSCSKL